MTKVGAVYKIGCVVGTRPEIIKMAPVIFALRECAWADVRLINTGQHRDLLDNMLDIFQLKTDVNLNIMTEYMRSADCADATIYRY